MHLKPAHPEDGNTNALHRHLEAEARRTAAVNARLRRILDERIDDVCADVVTKYADSIAEILSLMFAKTHSPETAAATLETLVVDEALARAINEQAGHEDDAACDVAWEDGQSTHPLNRGSVP